jgi:hypothetical protein
MKTTILLAFTAVAFLSDNAGIAQTPSPTAGPSLPAATAWAVAASAANSRIWERTVYEPGPNGTVVAKTRHYTELSSGLDHLVNGQYVRSRSEIDLLPPGGAFAAAATNGQHQAWFPLDISQGVIQLSTPNGKQLLQSRPVGLFFEDDSNSVLFAVLTNSTGELVGSNVVTYRNAFDGASASISYKYTRSSFSQDIVIQGQLPDPAALGLNPARVRLGVLTTFFDTNNPVAIPAPADPRNGLTDTTLIYGGQMQMGPGRAFFIGNASQSGPPNAGTPTYKHWFQSNGHRFLMEEVPYPQVAPQLEQLPPMTGRLSVGATNLLAVNSLLNAVPARLLQPPAPGVSASAARMRVAKTGLHPADGLVLDYVTLNTTLTDYVFQGDTTYYISGNVTLAGANSFEGGAVIKFARGTGITVVSTAIVNWLGGAYWPTVFTAMDDNSVGQPISGSTGSPSGYYADPALNFSSGSPTLADLRILYAQVGVAAPGMTIRDAQFVSCQEGASLQAAYYASSFLNVLFANVQTNFNCLQYIASVNAQNVTINNSSVVVAGPSDGVGITLIATNCIFANVISLSNAYVYSLSGSDNGFYRSSTFGLSQYTTSTSPFQMVGAGSYYLTASNSFRNVGTTNIDPTLLAELRTKTTYPPLVYSNLTLMVATTLSPQAERDNNDGSVDLGWHYDPIDYFFGGVTAYANVTFTAGTAFGWFELPGSGGPGFGLSASNGFSITFEGTVTAPCVSARYDSVQEGGDGLWKDKGWLAGLVGGVVSGGIYDPYNPAILNARFTFFSHLAGDSMNYRDYQPLRIRATDCEIYGNSGGYNMYPGFTNCLFYRGGFGQATSDSQYTGETYREIFRNCTFYGGQLNWTHWESPPYWQVSVRDCSFDRTVFNISAPNNTWLDDGYNAYLTGAATLPNSVGSDVSVTSFNWQSSWFGNYYLPPNSPLIDAGGVTADQVGLYHFTTQTNMEWNGGLDRYVQIPEANSTVDIGYHYVATDQYGNPLDSNGDGLPDYLEDANGNGSADSGEMAWNAYDDLGLKVVITRPRNGSTLP